MSQVKVSGNASGTGIFTIAAPNSNTNRTLTLPDNTGTLVTNATAGTVLQVVSTSTTTSVTNNTTTYVDSGLTLSITPSSASNKILAIASLPFQYGSNNYVYDNLRLMRGATQVSIVTIGNSVSAYVVVFNVHNITYLDSPATTSSVTYKIQHRLSSSAGEYGGEIFCPATNTATLTLMEIAA